MAIKYNGTSVGNVKYNGLQLDKVIFNGTTVWENWVEKSGTITLGGAGTQSGTDTNLKGKIPLVLETRWWWAGEGSGPTGRVKYTMYFTDGTSGVMYSSYTERDTTATDSVPSNLQKEINYISWSLETNVGSGVTRTTSEGYPRCTKWKQKGS